MKYAVLLAAVSVCTVTAFAQPNKVISAYNYERNGDLIEAKEAIDQAAIHEKTSGKAKTHFYRGKIYQGIAIDTTDKYKDIRDGASMTAATSYRKALDIGDKRLNEGEIKQGYQQTGYLLYQDAAAYFDAKQFAKSSEYFEAAVEVNQYFGRLDTATLNNAALAAERAGDNDRAIELYERVKETGYGGGKTYYYLMILYRQKGEASTGDDKAKWENKSFELLQEGRKMYPDNQLLLTEETNYFLQNPDKIEQALENLNQAIAKEPENATYYFARGTLYDKMDNREAAAADYMKATELDPSLSDAYYNLGALYVNRSGEIQEEMNQLDFKEQEKYDALKADRDAMFAKAVEPLEKAYELDSTNTGIVQTLMKLYSALGETEKYNKMRALLNK